MQDNLDVCMICVSSDVQTMCTDNYFPEDSHIIGDAAYALQKHVMVPYKNNGHLTEAQVNFNNRLCSARVMIERAIYYYYL